MGRLLIISFDAVGDAVFGRLVQRPHFAALARRSAVVRGVSSVFLTNTYPVHTSVATGLPQAAHRLISNTEPFPKRHPRWHTAARQIQAVTLWQAAAARGIAVAAVMWPVTGGAKEIRWNIPELMVQPGQSQVAENLKAGSRALQLVLYARYRGLLRGIAQPERDNFATACMADILRRKRPGLALMHLTAYDSLCHEHGPASPRLEQALDAMDENLGALLAAGAGMDVVLFSDHAQLPVEHTLLPNDLLVEQGLLEKDENGDYKEGGSFFECCGGSAFFHPRGPGAQRAGQVLERVKALEGFGRLLSADEMAGCGRAALPFGFAAKPGWACEAYPTGEKGNHGYPADYPGYKVFYMACGAAFAQGGAAAGGSLLDVAPLAAHALGLRMPGLRAPRAELLAHGPAGG